MIFAYETGARIHEILGLKLSDIIETDGKAELTCQFCPKVYRLDKGELKELLEKAE